MQSRKLSGLVIAGLLGVATTGWASTGTALDGIASTFTSILQLGIYLFGITAFAGIVVIIAQNRGSTSYVWDNALNILFAVGMAASGAIIVGWGGAALASTPPVPSAYELVVPAQRPQLPLRHEEDTW